MTQNTLDVAIQNATKSLKQAEFTQALAYLKPHVDDVSDVDSAEAAYLYAVALRYSNQPQQALATIQKVVASQPEHGRALQESGYCYLAVGQKDAAAKAFFDATLVNPALIASWQQLRHAYESLGESKSIQYATENLQFWQALPKPLLGAAQLLYDGKRAQADQVCRQFLRDHKHHPDGLYLLGLIGVKMEQYADAEFILETCIALSPQHVRARYEYGMLLNRLGKFESAKAQAEVLLAQQANNANFSILLGIAQIGLGNYREGITLFVQVLEEEPNRASLWLQLGHAYKTSGEIDLAIEAYQKAYTARPHYGDAYWSLTNTKTYSLSDKEITDACTLIEAGGLNREDYVHLCFAIGKTYEDRKSYADAFRYYQKGNDKQYVASHYSPDLTSNAVDQNCRVFNQALFEKLKGRGEPASGPIFIVGLPRAGSTLIEQILASHSQIEGTMELQNILSLVARLSQPNAGGDNYPDILSQLPDSYFQRFGQQYLEQTQQYRSGSPLFIDKMPNNFMHIGLIKLILPNAKIIDARREAMACCFSGYKQLFAEGQSFSYDLTALGRYYRDYERMMAHWDKVLPGQILRVNHEDVVDDLEGQVNRLLHFIDVPFEQQCIEFYQTKRAINTPSAQQVRQPIYRSGLNQWQHFAPYLGELKQALG